jgi:predicted Zn-ribbon and HTH transcriptional regulator
MKISSDIENNHIHDSHYDKPKYEVADIFRLYFPEYLKKHNVPYHQKKEVYDIMQCRTASLGFHKYKCDQCGFERIEYDSCRNRHCPKCQGVKRLQWVEARLSELLPVSYYHSVFTMPHTLNIVVLYNKKVIYDIFLSSCGETLKEFAKDQKYLGAKIGFTGILHTWGQKLNLHIHAHFIIPGGGISTDNKKWVNLPYRKDFLFPVKAMSMRMRKIFSQKLQKAYDEGKLVFPDSLSYLNNPDKFKVFLNKVAWDKWINYTKKPFSSPEKVVKYIGRYPHRVAISNHRILDIAKDMITIKYRDYRASKDGGISSKVMTISAEEFIRRFLLHTLPKGFKKIRHYGIFGSGKRKEYIKLAKELLGAALDDLKACSGVFNSILNKLFKCPVCKKGVMHLVENLLFYKLRPG